MANNEDAIMQTWNGVLSLYGRAPVVDPVPVGILLKAFKDYDTLEVTQAINEYVQSGATYAPVPGQILELLNKKRGKDQENLAHMAEDIYQQMENNCNSACDWIVADPRACVAIDQVYGSPQNFAKSNFTEYQEEKKHHDFVDAYCKATRQDALRVRNYFGGYYSHSDDPIVRFLGNYQRCLAIAGEVFVGRHPRLPQDPATVKSLPKPVDRPLTPEERKHSKMMLNKALDMLKGMRI